MKAEWMILPGVSWAPSRRSELIKLKHSLQTCWLEWITKGPGRAKYQARINATTFNMKPTRCEINSLKMSAIDA